MTTMSTKGTRSTSRKGPERGVWPSVMFLVVGIGTTLLLTLGGGFPWFLVWLAVGGVVTWWAALAWRRGGRWGGAVALTFGVFGFAVGTGIGVRWLQAGAVGLRATASMVVLVASVGLTAVGIARLTRGLRSIARVVSGLSLVLIFAILVWTFTPAVLATNVPPLALGDPTPTDFGLDVMEVRYLADDGTEMWAWYMEPADGAVVVLRHGSGSTAEDVLAQAAVLVENGYGVLATDARGHGRSGGSAMDFGWYGTRDIEAAVTFLSGQPGVDPGRIAVIGLSMGGEEAIGAAGADDRIAAVVAEGATARTEVDKAWLVEEYGWRGRIQVGLERLQYSFTELLTDAEKPPPLATAAELFAPRPILLITAGRLPDERYAAEHIRAEARGNVTIWTIPDAGHIDGLLTAPLEWEEAVIDFLDSALGP